MPSIPVLGSRYLLGSGPDRQSYFYFKATSLAGGKIRVSIEVEGVGDAHASVDLARGDEGRVHFLIPAYGTTFVANGILRWDDPYHVVRYEGDLGIANIAGLTMQDCPVIELPLGT